MKLLQPRRFHPRKAAWVLLVLAAFTLYTTYRDRPTRLWKWSGQVMGSSYTVQVVEKRFSPQAWAELQAQVDRQLQELNQELSTWETDSTLSRFNAGTSTEPVVVSPAMAEVTRIALEVSRRSGGTFDITFSPLFDLWGFGRAGAKRQPALAEIEQTRQRCGYQHLSVPSPTTIQKAIPDLQVVYNAIVPGFAADQVTAWLRQAGYSNTYVDVGGETVVQGHNAEGRPWRLGIETPMYDAEPGASLEAVVQVTDCALATSGDYRNYFRDESGRVFSHIFDPRTGYPATTPVGSVSVIAESGAVADALATTLFVMGPEEGIPWLAREFPQAHALFILRESETTLREVATPGFEQATGYHPRAGVLEATSAPL
jgi:thiamine biosynthesis lipoprotein